MSLREALDNFGEVAGGIIWVEEQLSAGGWRNTIDTTDKGVMREGIELNFYRLPWVHLFKLDFFEA